MTVALAIPPLTVKNRPCALIYACALKSEEYSNFFKIIATVHILAVVGVTSNLRLQLHIQRPEKAGLF